LEALASEGIESRYIGRDRQSGTGVSSPLVEPDGSNSIVYVPRANARLAPADIEAAAPALAATDAVLLQLETPISASLRAAQIAREAGALVILNPAPASRIPDPLWAFCDVLVPNEIEVAMLSGCPVEDPLGGARVLLARGPRAVVVTLGEQGALLVTPRNEERFAAHKVEVIDSVAAGDAFCGALAVCLAEGVALPEAVRFANAAGALAVTVAGAFPSMPQRKATNALLSGETAQSP
jgi:ribokinase